MDHFPTFPKLSEAYDERALLRERRYRRTQKGLAMTAITLGVLNVDAAYQIYEQSQNNVSVRVVSEASEPENDNRATVVMAGFGGLDSGASARAIDESLGAAGETWSVRLDNQNVDTSAIAREIGEFAEERGVNEVSLYGISFGGIYNLPIALELVKGDYGITSIPSAIFNDTPSSEACIKPRYTEDSRKQEWAHRTFPLISKSIVARTIAELYIRKDRLWPPEKIPTTLETTWRIVNSPNAASNQLLHNQYNEFLSIDAEATLRDLRHEQRERGMTPTTWSYIGNEKDYTINTDCAVRELRLAIARTGFGQMHTTYIEGSKHGEPYLTPDLYNETLPTVLNEALAAYQYKRTAFSTPSEALQ